MIGPSPFPNGARGAEGRDGVLLWFLNLPVDLIHKGQNFGDGAEQFRRNCAADIQGRQGPGEGGVVTQGDIMVASDFQNLLGHEPVAFGDHARRGIAVSGRVAQGNRMFWCV